MVPHSDEGDSSWLIRSPSRRPIRLALSGREQFAAALDALQKALRGVQAAVDDLPALTADPDGELGGPDWSPCCKNTDLRVITVGLEQWCKLGVAGGRWNASTNGWDDMGDLTGPDFVECEACGAAFRAPDGLRWDGM